MVEVANRPELLSDEFLSDEFLSEDLLSLNLSMISMKLQDAEEGAGWPEDLCERVALEYRRFLALTRRYPDKGIVPSTVVDKFWHAHILDTKAYAADCDRVFGRFVHHFPYWGMRGEADARELHDAYDETLALYAKHWGSPDGHIWESEGASRCPKCGRR